MTTYSSMKTKIFTNSVSCGFPSPAEGLEHDSLSLDEHLITHPAATFMARAAGNSMIDAGIFDGDILIVDRSLNASHGDVVIVAIDGELVCKILDMDSLQLVAANHDYSPIKISDDQETLIEGVVKASVRLHRPQ